MRFLSVVVAIIFLAASASAAPYEVTADTEIVLFHDPATGAGFDWAALSHPRLAANLPEHRLRDGVRFLQEALKKMTGREPTIRSDVDLSRGIIVVLRQHAPAELRDDQAICRALESDGTDAYNDREAFYCRSERSRLLIVANTVDGLVAAMPALLEKVGYEVLGMGPNWVHVPKPFRERPTFDLELADRPSYYLRQIVPTTGQSYGVGTIMEAQKFALSDSADEPVNESYARWAVGARIMPRSMAPFPGHALYLYHKRTAAEMVRTSSTVGFLTPKTHLGLDADRPAAAPENDGHLWLNTDAAPTKQTPSPGHAQAYLSDGKTWKLQNPNGFGVNLDITSEFCRRLVFEELKERAIKHFASPYADEPLVFGTEPEDGAGLRNIGAWCPPENRNWYVDYLKSQRTVWPDRYVLDNYRGIKQPQEKWDADFPADHIFGFNNWLLREFDNWLTSLPSVEQRTVSGKNKHDLVRVSCYSYAYHDVPPHINLDPRIRVMIAGYPKHRGLGEWKRFASARDMAQTFKVMLPNEPSGEYRIISIAYYADFNMEGIPARWSAAPERILNDLGSTFESGTRALTFETDFNFGKYGLAYYLMSKVLWNAKLTPEELTAIRERWLRRAFGTGATKMREYYDFLLSENFPANAPASWAKAIRLLDAADALIDPETEPDEQRRLDDVKQFWLYYYLLDTGAVDKKSPEFVEFVWKGQMSYMTAMHMVVHRHFGWRGPKVHELVGPELSAGPAHYSAAETAAWWKKILEHWPSIEVNQFADAVLADGSSGRDVDVNDLVRVVDWQPLATLGKPFLFNSAQAPNTTFLTIAQAGEPIGFVFSWPAGDNLRFYGPKDVPYGAEFWDAESRKWTPVVDVTLSTVASQTVALVDEKLPENKRVRHMARVELPAPQSGTYRFEVGRGGFTATLSGLGFNTAEQRYESRRPMTFADRPGNLTQDPAYFYIPKGTKRLDLEVWDAHNRKQLQLHRGIGDKGLIKSRTVDVSRRGTHRIELEPGEDGNLVQVSGNGFAFPLLYSVPLLWAKSPAELLVPRRIAAADGLKVILPVRLSDEK